MSNVLKGEYPEVVANDACQVGEERQTHRASRVEGADVGRLPGDEIAEEEVQADVDGGQDEQSQGPAVPGQV